MKYGLYPGWNKGIKQVSPRETIEQKHDRLERQFALLVWAMNNSKSYTTINMRARSLASIAFSRKPSLRVPRLEGTK